MASACLPAVFRAVEIDGVPYWDGGYLGNPVALSRSSARPQTEDVLIVQINPLVRKKMPTSTREIMSRRQRDHLQFLADGANCAPSNSSTG